MSRTAFEMSRRCLVLGGFDTPLDGQLDVSFLLNGFCMAGLPLRRPRDNTLVSKRQDERMSASP
jgi:hypothetical protein